MQSSRETPRCVLGSQGDTRYKAHLDPAPSIQMLALYDEMYPVIGIYHPWSSRVKDFLIEER